MAFCTYIFVDPKSNIPRYVGKGLLSRPAEHLKHQTRSHQRLRRMLKKRVLEGFNPKPTIILADNEQDAFEMEELLIAMVGREDLGSGTLFNNTNGGEGESGRIVSDETRRKTSISYHSRPEEEKAKTFKMLSDHKKSMWASWSDAQRKDLVSRQAKSRSRRCTIDGITIFESRLALIQALGQSNKGSRSPNFRHT